LKLASYIAKDETLQSEAKMKFMHRKSLATVVFSTFLATPALLSAQEQQNLKPPLPRYTVADLGTLPGGTFSQATFLNNNGLVTGLSTTADGTQHAVLWVKGSITDLAKNAPAGTNSGAFAVNEWGQVLGQTETTTKDPNNENFCAYGTGLTCRAFLWQNGVMTLLPTLGGDNSAAGLLNNRGDVIGMAETAIRDPKCPSTPAVTGTGPIAFDFEAVTWGPRPGQIGVLRPLPGDSVGMAFGINDLGQIVGGSGSCANTILPGPAVAPHAVLWENGTVTSMGSLGGSVDPEGFGVGTIAFAINNQGQAVGAAALPGNATSHAFLWSKKLRHMVDLGTVSGDVYSAGLDINNQGEVVGSSFNADGNPSAFLFMNGAIKDLNTFVPADSPVYMLVAFAINDLGQIVGFGVDSAGDVHGFLATPCGLNHPDANWCDGDAVRADVEGDQAPERPRPALSERARELLRRRMHFGGFGTLHTASQ
jgi:probable HAF family extracellular repeat protein